MTPFWILLKLRMMEMVVTIGAIRHVKLQSNCHHQLTDIQLPDAFPDVQLNNVKSIEGKSITYHELAHPRSTGGLPTSFLIMKGSWISWG